MSYVFRCEDDVKRYALDITGRQERHNLQSIIYSLRLGRINGIAARRQVTLPFGDTSTTSSEVPVPATRQYFTVRAAASCPSLNFSPLDGVLTYSDWLWFSPCILTRQSTCSGLGVWAGLEG